MNTYSVHTHVPKHKNAPECAQIFMFFPNAWVGNPLWDVCSFIQLRIWPCQMTFENIQRCVRWWLMRPMGHGSPCHRSGTREWEGYCGYSPHGCPLLWPSCVLPTVYFPVSSCYSTLFQFENPEGPLHKTVLSQVCHFFFHGDLHSHLMIQDHW